MAYERKSHPLRSVCNTGGVFYIRRVACVCVGGGGAVMLYVRYGVCGVVRCGVCGVVGYGVV